MKTDCAAYLTIAFGVFWCGTLIAQQTVEVADKTVVGPAGIAVIQVPALSETLLSTPFEPFDSSVDAVFQGQLTTVASNTPGDLIRLWDPTRNCYITCEKDAFGLWQTQQCIDQTEGSSATIDLRIEPGRGFVIANRQPFSQTVVLSGLVVSDDKRCVTLPTGINLVGYPFSSSGSSLHTEILGSFWPAEDGVLSMTVGYWVLVTNQTDTVWTAVRPYSIPFQATQDVRISSISWDAGKNQASLVVCVTSPEIRNVNILKKAMQPEDTFDASNGWKCVATNVTVENDGLVHWTDTNIGVSGAANIELYTVVHNNLLYNLDDATLSGEQPITVGVPAMDDAVLQSETTAHEIPVSLVEFEQNLPMAGDSTPPTVTISLPASNSIIVRIP